MDEITSAVPHDERPVEAVQDDATLMKNVTSTESIKSDHDHPISIATNSKSSASSITANLQNLTDSALHFLAHASNETLGACFLGLGASTYLILGKVGLVIIGVAGGVVLHATWEGLRGDHRDEDTKKLEQEKRREVGVEIVKRVLQWREDSTDGMNGDRSETKIYASQDLDYSSFGPETQAALNTFTDAVINDYVRLWYDPTIPDEAEFPSASRRTFTAFVLSLTGHLKRKRPADVFLDFVTNASSIIVVFLNELSVALRASPTASAEDAIATYLKLKPDSNLAYILDEQSQKTKLAAIAEDILQAYLDPKSYNCAPVHVFLKQVLARLVLGYTVTHCARAEWINDWIVYGLEESETTKEVMDIVDAGVEGRPARSTLTTPTSAPTPAVNDALEKPPVRNEPIAETPDMRLQKSVTTITSQSVDSPVQGHRRQASRAEEAMDEAMNEARRLTQLMLEEDLKRAEEERLKEMPMSGLDQTPGTTTPGLPTPTSSMSDKDKLEVMTPETSSQLSVALDDSAFEHDSPVTSATKQQFTNFDQLVEANPTPTALVESPKPHDDRPPLTLHRATVAIFDDSMPGERAASLKAKPTMDFLIQIEPAVSSYSGWMIARKYADFEILHEVLRRISVITGVHQFAHSHKELPKWKVHTKSSLRSELERYLADAVHYQSLAESEGMKRFLEKDRGLDKSPGGQVKGFGWPTPDAFNKFGGDMMNVLTKAPKQVAGGGKAVLGGVAGGGMAVIGGVSGLMTGVAGNKRANQSQMSLGKGESNSSLPETTSSPLEASRSSLADSQEVSSSPIATRPSQDSARSLRASRISGTFSNTTDPVKSDVNPVLPPRPSSGLSRPAEIESHPESLNVKTEKTTHSPVDHEESLNLPPPPSEMPDDFVSPTSPSRKSSDLVSSTPLNPRLSKTMAESPSVSFPPATPPRPSRPTLPPRPESKPKNPLTDREAAVAVELMFAVISELYTLSSAWNIRRTLLTAAKTFLLRPGNPQMTTIRDLLQDSLLANNLSDEGLARHIYKLRQNTLPTTEETERWTQEFPDKTDQQKEELRIKARRLLVTKGMPQALTSVMGAAASGEALGKVFDCLQIPSVSRGLIFGLMLQALRVLSH